MRRVVFVYANDPEPILLERMSALEDTGRYEAYAVYWHRTGSPLSIPWSSALDAGRFIQIELPDPRGGLLRRLFLTARYVLSLRRELKKLNAEVITPIYPDMLFAAKLAMLGRSKVPMMYELWDVIGAEIPDRFVKRFTRKLMQGLRAVFVTSEGYDTKYLQPNGFISETTKVVYASNSPAGWKFRAPESSEDKPELTVAYIGQIRVAPQLQNLVTAVGSLHEIGLQIKLLIAGGGQDSDWIKSLSESSEFIDYRGPYDFQKDAEMLYSESDVLFAVYPQQQFNYRVHWARRGHQAILSGIPLIVARGSVMGRYIDEHGLGWLVDDDSPAELESLLAMIAENRADLMTHRTDSESILSEHKFESYQDRVVAEYDALFE